MPEVAHGTRVTECRAHEPLEADDAHRFFRVAPDGHCAAGRLAVAKEEVVWFGKSHGKAGSSSSDVSMRSVSQAAVCQLHKFVVVPEQGVDGCATFTPNVRCENDKAQGA